MCDAGACSVCLDPLLGQDDGDDDRAIGAFTPCGHVLHVACYEEMKKTAASRGGGRSRSSPPPASRSAAAAVVVKCPNCNTPSKHFMRLYGLSKGTEKSAAEAAPTRPAAPAPRRDSSSTSARNAAAAAPSSATTRRSAAGASPPGPRPPSTPPSSSRRAAGQRRRGDDANPTPVQQTQQQQQTRTQQRQQQQQQQSRPTAAASHRVGRMIRARRPASSIATPSTTRRTAFGAFRADRTPAASVTPSRPFCPSPPPPPPPPPILPPAVVPPPYCAPPPTVFVPHSPFAFGSRATDGAAAAPQRSFIANPVAPSNPAAGNLTNTGPYYAASYSVNDGLSAFHHGTTRAAAAPPVNFPHAIPNANHPDRSWNGGGLGAAGGFAAAAPVVFSVGVHPARPKRKRRPRNRPGGGGVGLDRMLRPAPQRHLQSPGTTPLPFSVRCCGNQQCSCRGSAGL